MSVLNDTTLLTWLIFLPLLGGAALLLLPSRAAGVMRGIALAIMIADFALGVMLFLRFDASNTAYQFVQRVTWIENLGVQYHVGVDGISLLLVLLTVFLGPLVILSVWASMKDQVRMFLFTLLMLQTGMLGVFCAIDLFLFYVFWEAMLIPMYFLIGVWGGERRIYAAVKFFIYTMAGSVLMLVGILVLYYQYQTVTGQYSFNLTDILRYVNLQPAAQIWMFLAFAVAFAVKVPMFPFHTWLPDAHVEAPTAGSVILAGVLLKMGTYGFMRFCLPLFPDASMTFIPIIASLAVVGIIYGALVAMVQPDVKKLVAYSSVSHLGFVMLGLFTFTIQGMQGGLIQMINHGLSTGGLFLMVGMLYERRHTRLIADYGGLSKSVPVFAAFFMIVVLSSLGLPGLNGFVGEFLVLVGAIQLHWGYAALAGTGVILAACYLLWMYQRMMFGPLTHEANRTLADMNVREIAYMTPILIMIVWLGVYPKPFLDRTEPAVRHLLQQMATKQQLVRQQAPESVQTNFIIAETPVQDAGR